MGEPRNSSRKSDANRGRDEVSELRRALKMCVSVLAGECMAKQSLIKALGAAYAALKAPVELVSSGDRSALNMARAAAYAIHGEDEKCCGQHRMGDTASTLVPFFSEAIDKARDPGQRLTAGADRSSLLSGLDQESLLREIEKVLDYCDRERRASGTLLEIVSRHAKAVAMNAVHIVITKVVDTCNKMNRNLEEAKSAKNRPSNSELRRLDSLSRGALAVWAVLDAQFQKMAVEKALEEAR